MPATSKLPLGQIQKSKYEQRIITNKITSNLKSSIIELSDKSDYMKIAVAFFSDNEIIRKWVDDKKNMDILVSLRPPTNYYTLKSLQSHLNINSHFLNNSFHSKIYPFYKQNNLFTAILGSSNFTNGGLLNNIETNIILTDEHLLKQIEKQFIEIWELSYLLQPSDLDKYKQIYDNNKNRDNQTEKEQDEFEHKILKNRQKRLSKQRISKEAKRYFAFWKIVNEVKNIVQDISNKEYPNIPTYLTIDHFWHWIKVIWSKEGYTIPNNKNRNEIIKNLFVDYCQWDKLGDNHTNLMWKTSKNIFMSYLSKEQISNLTSEQAKEIYRNFHFGKKQTKRFKTDEKLVKENNIKEIKQLLNYLLYLNDDLELRIHNLINNEPKYKVKYFGNSAIQEVIGWVNPDLYPLRNEKADEAIKILGYDIDGYITKTQKK